MAGRKDQTREPVEGNEVLSVIQRRLLAKLPTEAEAAPAANAYQEIVTQMRRAYARSKAESQQAEEEGLALRNRLRAAYPFHPALIGLMRERWAAIPEFQRTRGALRFLAACLRAAHRAGKSRALLGPGDVPIHDPEVRLAFFKEVGQQPDFQAVLEQDFLGPNARVAQIDDRRAKQQPQEGARRPATRLATAILMYSFGGLRREGSKEGEILPPGITEAELLSVCVGPDLDSTTALACLKELSPTSSSGCLYLHFDGARYCFKKDPNITLLLEQEAEIVGRDQNGVRAEIQKMIEARLAGHHNAIVWPKEPGGIPDRDPSFLVAYLPLEFAARPPTDQETHARELLEKYGEKLRTYRNGLGLAIPTADQVEGLRKAVRYLLAADGVKAKAKQFKLTEEQLGELRERKSTEGLAAESALLKLYTEVWLPRAEGGGIALDKVPAGGRPLQTTLNDKKQAMLHERIVELITQVYKKVFDKTEPGKIVDLFRLGQGSPPQLGIAVSEVADGFFSYLGFPRLMTTAAIQKGIAKGIADGHFGYVTGPKPALSAAGKFEVAPEKVRFKVPILEDEIDLESGFLMLPQAIPQPEVKVCPKCGKDPCECPSVCPRCGQFPCACPAPCPKCGHAPCTCPAVCPRCGKSPCVCAKPETMVELTFTADRNELFTAWNAIANLADLAGNVTVTIHAESEEGFDKGKLQNGVLEPLREADLIE
jgi:hypothetical protein